LIISINSGFDLRMTVQASRQLIKCGLLITSKLNQASPFFSNLPPPVCVSSVWSSFNPPMITRLPARDKIVVSHVEHFPGRNG
jgi:hypothetical protein